MKTDIQEAIWQQMPRAEGRPQLWATPASVWVCCAELGCLRGGEGRGVVGVEILQSGAHCVLVMHAALGSRQPETPCAR